jgi:hypothetical protein
MRTGFRGGKVDGSKKLIPADFLIGPDLTIERAFYGTHIGDHLPIAEIESFLEDSVPPPLVLEASPQVSFV